MASRPTGAAGWFAVLAAGAGLAAGAALNSTPVFVGSALGLLLLLAAGARIPGRPRRGRHRR